MDPDLDLFKDYFESFNESYPDPVSVCEENDPLGLGSDLGDLVTEGNLLTSNVLLHDDLPCIDPQNNLENPVKQESDNAPSQDLVAAEQRTSSFLGLKIADFAVDPDLCSILEPSSSTGVVQTETEIEAQPSKAFIRLSKTKEQLRKNYKISNLDVQIVTSGPEENSFEDDLKLLLPTTEKVIDTHLTVTPAGSGYLLSSDQLWIFSNGWHKQRDVTVLDGTQAKDFFSGRKAIDKIYLLSTSVLISIAMFLHQKNFFFYFKEAANYRFHTSLKKLEFEQFGHEGTPEQPVDPRRLENVKKLEYGLTSFYQQKLPVASVGSLNSAALLMEQDMREQLNYDQELVSRSVLGTLRNFIDRVNTRTEYLHLMNLPDIYYLALTKPHIKLVTQTVRPGVRQAPSPLRMTTSLRAPRSQIRATAVSSGVRGRNVPVILQPCVSVSGPRVSLSSPPTTSRPQVHLPTLPVVRDPLLKQALCADPKPSPVVAAPIKPSQPVIVKVASMAPPPDLYVCPFYPSKCRDGSFKTRTSLVYHWTMDHFFSLIANLLQTLQLKQQ